MLLLLLVVVLGSLGRGAGTAKAERAAPPPVTVGLTAEMPAAVIVAMKL